PRHLVSFPTRRSSDLPDGSSVYGILFANWYCNGNEIPVNEKDAKAYWDQHLHSLEKYAASPHMLMMNGCDHQPIQTDLSEAIQTDRKSTRLNSSHVSI